MNCRFLLLVIIFLSSINLVLAQVEVLSFLPDFDKGKKLAKAEDKYILVDVMADWCEQCKKMDKEVYTDPEVINFFGERFISVKLDGERRGAGFVRKRQVTGFPTLLFFNSDGKELHRIEGYADAHRLIQTANIAFRDPKKKASRFRADYRKYKDNPKYLRDYVVFCEETEDFEMADKLSDQYVKHIAKIDSVEWMDFVMRFVNKEKSKLFDILKKNKPAFDALYDKEEVDQVFIDILINTELWKMRDPTTDKLIKKTKERINKHKLKISDEQLYPAFANRVFSTDIAFQNDEGRTAFAVRILKNHSEEVEEKILGMVLASVAVHQTKKDILVIAKEQIVKLIKNEPTMSLHDINSIILYKLGEKEESFKQVALAQKYAVATKQKYRSSLKIMKDSGMVK